MLALIFISQIYTIPLFLTGPWNNTASKAKQLGRDGTGQATATTKSPWTTACLHCPGRSAHIVRPFEFYHRHIPTPSSSSHILFATIRVMMLTGASVGAAWNGETGNSISPPVTSGNEDLCRRIFSVHPYTSWYPIPPILLSSSTGTVPLDSHNTEMD